MLMLDVESDRSCGGDVKVGVEDAGWSRSFLAERVG